LQFPNLLFQLLYLQVSIIIVNYNVRHFLEQCLLSVHRALAGIDAEVLVVDNASTDGSLDYLQPLFPRVQFIRLQENLGFAKANNHAARLAKGEYLLFLNPDTLVAEDAVYQMLDFMQQHPQAGALGLRMLDGSGEFLPESKRAFPALMPAFFKLTGFARLFPRSAVFNAYALGHLHETENHPVDVLAGACMLVRRNLLLQLGGFDEQFFMYGEDIDLSYRIRQAGYENWYCADNSIIHFKGESTRKGSSNYVQLFYKAMQQFVRKHYSGGKSALIVQGLQAAILLRAGISLIKRFVTSIGMPLMDGGIIFCLFWMSKSYWETYIKQYPFERAQIFVLLPAFVLVYWLAAAFSGLYHRIYAPKKLLSSLGLALLSTLAVYALLPEGWRFSRAVILIGSMGSGLGLGLFRWWLLRIRWLKPDATGWVIDRAVVLVHEQDLAATQSFMQSMQLNNRVIHWSKDESDCLRAATELRAHEIVLVVGHHPLKQLIAFSEKLQGKIALRFHYVGSNSIIGSDSKDSSGYTLSK
jgi:GT2 family glycosyltransferase